jgi:putative ABC transport system permease protein
MRHGWRTTTLKAMTLSTLVFNNLFRQRVRTLLTMLGIAIGVATVVALGSITEGLKGSSGEFIRAGGADFMVAQDGASDLSFSAVSESDWHAIAAHPDVDRATGLLLEVADVGSNRSSPPSATSPRRFQASQSTSWPGGFSRPEPSRSTARQRRGAGTGRRRRATVELDRAQFDVVGIYRTGEHWRTRAQSCHSRPRR